MRRPLLWCVLSLVLPVSAAAQTTPTTFILREMSWSIGGHLSEMPTAAGDVNGDGIGDLVVGTTTFGGSKGRVDLCLGLGWDYSPIAPTDTCFPIYYGLVLGDYVGQVVSAVGDLDGDGYDEIAVGIPSYDSTYTDEGAVFVFKGPLTEISEPAWEFYGNDESCRFGTSISWAGDVNGDGYDDFIAGGPFWGVPGGLNPVQGAVWGFYGSASGPQPGWFERGGGFDLQFGASVAGLGDVNGDGYDDVAVGAPAWTLGVFQTNAGLIRVFHGSANGLSLSPDWELTGQAADEFIGESVARAGDTNGDGYADLIATSPSHGTDGAIRIFRGGTSGLEATPSYFVDASSGTGAQFRRARAGGDLNGDGYADCLVEGVGSLHVLLGSDTSIERMEFPDYGIEEGFTEVQPAGDMNEDGRSDIVLAKPGGLPSDSVQLLQMTHGTPTTSGTSEFHWTRENETNFAGLDPDGLYGTGVAGTGDVNGDGYDDFVMGAMGTSQLANDAGSVEMYLGSSQGLRFDGPDWIALGDQPGGNLGLAVDIAGDVNGDGYADILVSEPGVDRIVAYYGGPVGSMSTTPDWSHTFEEAGAQFGYFVSGVGDLNADGYHDIAAGTPFYDGFLVDQGIVRVFFGGPTGLGTQNSTLTSNLSDADFGIDAAGSNVNGDAYSDLAVSALGQVHIYLGTSTGLSPTPAYMVDSISGWFGGPVSKLEDVLGAGPGGTTLPIEHLVAGSPHTIDDGAYPIISFYPNVTCGAGLLGPLPNYAYGWSTSTAGDWDFDGLSNVIYGGPLAQSVVLGRVSTQNVQGRQWVADMTGSFECCQGLAVTGGGDFNGDAIPDFGAGTGDRYGFQVPFLVSGLGNAHVFYGTSGRSRVLYRPRQTTVAGEPIALGGLLPNNDTTVRLSFTGFSAGGSVDIHAEMQLAPLGVPFPAPTTSATTSLGPNAPSVDFAIDFSLLPSTSYRWRMRAVIDDPYFPSSPWLTNQPATPSTKAFRTRTQVVATPETQDRPTVLFFDRVWPNPSPGQTTVAFGVHRQDHYRLDVIDVAGRHVARLVDQTIEPGMHRMTWDGRTTSGTSVANGVYFLRLASDSSQVTTKVLMVK